jgi:hypothetical protein
LTYSDAFGAPQLKRVRQGEIISHVPELVVNPGTSDIAIVPRQFTAVITPDCDLERHWDSYSKGERASLRVIHLLMGVDATDRAVIKKDVWGRIKKADHSSYHAIEACPKEIDLEGKGCPPLAFDLKQLFSIPIEYLYQEIEKGVVARRAQLLSPYRDHMMQRFGAYWGRVALERNHNLPQD